MPNPSSHGILAPVIILNNIPVYFSSGGTATLILREIPYSGRAYILLRTLFPDSLDAAVRDCVNFCVQCGAGRCFVSLDGATEPLPLPHAYDILRLHCNKADLPTPAAPVPLIPITPENDSHYLRIYNRCFAEVSHALFYDRGQLQRIYREGQSAFLALAPDGAPCGIGELHGNELAAVALLPEYRGRGTDLTLALLEHCPGPEITLTVASDNGPALALYDRLGFRVTATESSWYNPLK